MEVVRHQYKFMQQLFLLLSVVKKDVEKGAVSFDPTATVAAFERCKL